MKIPLPSSCSGCPFYQYRHDPENGFVPDRIVPNSQIYFLAQNPGKAEVLGQQLIRRHGYGNEEYAQVAPQPLIGATGQVFTTRFLPLSGLQRSEVSLGNAIRCRPGKALGLPKADELPPIGAAMRLDNKSKAAIVNALKHCKSVHFNPPDTTKIIVTMGRHAMFIMTGIAKEESEYDDHKKMPSALESWRGYAVDVTDTWRSHHPVDVSTYHDVSLLQPQLSKVVVYVTMHIAALFYGGNKRFYHATLQDFHKLKLLLAGSWPKPIPSWSNTPPPNWPGYSAFDTEYNPTTAELYRWSLCDKDGNVYCVESDGIGSIIPVRQGSTVLIQNALADIGYLGGLVDISAVKIEDLMLAHSVLWSGEPHSLNYINSLYGTLNRYKHLISSKEPALQQLYSALDAWEPMQMWKSYFIPEFKRDQQSWYIYKKYRLPLINIIHKAQQAGVRVDTAKLLDVQTILTERVAQYKLEAKIITGDEDFNIGGSKRLMEEIYV